MSHALTEIQAALIAFGHVAELAGFDLAEDDILLESLNAPHKQPSRLPLNRTAVYCFWGDGAWLKIGHAGAQSGPRFTSQHYNPRSAPSTLAASLLRCSDFASRYEIAETEIGNWIRTHCDRINLLIEGKQPRELRYLLEAFLHARFRPRYER